MCALKFICANVLALVFALKYLCAKFSCFYSICLTFFPKRAIFYKKIQIERGLDPVPIKPFYLYISFYNSQSVHVAIELSSTIHVLYAIMFLLVY